MHRSKIAKLVLIALGCAISTIIVLIRLSWSKRTHHLAPARIRLVAATCVDVDEWKRNVVEELAFWNEWLKTKGLDWPDVYVERTKSREIGEDIKAAIPNEAKWSGRTLRILDAGAGPLTTLGDWWTGKDIEVHACDALAREFDRLLDRYGVVPPVRTIRADFETLSSTFPSNHFDIVHIRNALDQAYDPVKGISEALAVTRMHGVVYLSHALRNAMRSGNKGLHIWNFDSIDGHPFMWNCRHVHNLTELFMEETQITHTVTGGWINIRMMKLA